LTVPRIDQLPGAREFIWRDGDRIVTFGEGRLRGSLETFRAYGWERFELLTTERALRDAPLEFLEQAAAVHHVPDGPVNEISAGLLERVRVPTLAALGGGRVIDSAKAVAAVRGGRVAALPTTLSGAEMTTVHRLPEGHTAARRVRPALLVADPTAMTELPDPALRASAMNSLAHGAEALYVPAANPLSTLAALRGAELIALALDQAADDRDRAALALGSMLSAYAMDGSGYALHHVVCQTLVRALRIPHAETNATMLPHTLGAMRSREPRAIAALARALGTDPDGLGERVSALGGGPRRLSDLGAEQEGLDAAIDAMLDRAELRATPDPPGHDELRTLIQAAW
jgi:alcohol dehydrogenase class IV